jgi:hypothetical protein
MTRILRAVRHGPVVSGTLACYLLLLFVVPLVHDEVTCARSATHCVTCAASGMAAAQAGRVSTVIDPHLTSSGFVRASRDRLPDTILPTHRTGRSPPVLHLEQV